MKHPIEKMRKCLALLPLPGGEVVAECLDEIELLRQQVTLLRASVEELIPQNPLDTEHQYKVHHRALKALTTTEQKEQGK